MATTLQRIQKDYTRSQKALPDYLQFVYFEECLPVRPSKSAKCCPWFLWRARHVFHPGASAQQKNAYTSHRNALRLPFATCHVALEHVDQEVSTEPMHQPPRALPPLHKNNVVVLYGATLCRGAPHGPPPPFDGHQRG